MEFNGDFLEDADDGLFEYELDVDYNTDANDVEPALTDIINDNDIPGAMFLGMALGLAEEIADSDRYSEIENTPMRTVSERDVPQNSSLLSMKKDSGDKRGKFEKYVDNIIAGNRLNLPWLP